MGFWPRLLHLRPMARTRSRSWLRVGQMVMTILSILLINNLSPTSIWLRPVKTSATFFRFSMTED
jgi:hypothetical protein